jgi:hypothetical protein
MESIVRWFCGLFGPYWNEKKEFKNFFYIPSITYDDGARFCSFSTVEEYGFTYCTVRRTYVLAASDICRSS